MLIMNQNRNMLINLDNVCEITTSFVDPAQMDIDISFTNGEFETIGSYRTEERALEVLQKIAKSIGATEVFYMPEE